MKLSEEQLAQAKAVELEILDAISAACDSLGIAFFLDGGTLLGAARHGGFIPWDDDIDIGMLRKDFQTFLEKGQSALPQGFFLQSYRSDPDCPTSFAKVRKDGTMMLECGVPKGSLHNGIWVDIFPYDWIDAAPKNRAKKRRQWRLWRKLNSLRLADEPRACWSFKKKVLATILHVPIRALPKRWFVERLDSLGDTSFPSGKSLVCFHSYACFLDMSESDLLPLDSLSFEGRVLPVACRWDKYLTQVYGNWKELPPFDQRNTNHQIAEFHV